MVMDFARGAVVAELSKVTLRLIGQKTSMGTGTDFSGNPMSHSKFVSFRLPRNECQTGSVFPASE
jgi:hypothetical protein